MITGANEDDWKERLRRADSPSRHGSPSVSSREVTYESAP